MQFYGYNKCQTCRKAKAFLEKRAIAFEDIDITQTPPPAAVLKAALKNGYRVADLFNRSGELYREFNMKEKVKTLSESDLLALLTKHGKLVKRPVAADGGTVTVGFDEAVFKKTWK